MFKRCTVEPHRGTMHWPVGALGKTALVTSRTQEHAPPVCANHSRKKGRHLEDHLSLPNFSERNNSSTTKKCKQNITNGTFTFCNQENSDKCITHKKITVAIIIIVFPHNRVWWKIRIMHSITLFIMLSKHIL